MISFSKFWRTSVLFSSDICETTADTPGFWVQRKGGSLACMIPYLCEIISDSDLVWHLMTSWCQHFSRAFFIYVRKSIVRLSRFLFVFQFLAVQCQFILVGWCECLGITTLCCQINFTLKHRIKNLHPEHRTIYYFSSSPWSITNLKWCFPEIFLLWHRVQGTRVHIKLRHVLRPVSLIPEESTICNVSTSGHLTEYKLVNIVELRDFYYEIRSRIGRKYNT